MAEARGQLQKLTECCICFKTFTDPRMLPCIHTFCLECLKQTDNQTFTLSGWNTQQSKTMSCPLCRKEFTIPAEGLGGLQKNFFIEHLIEITQNLQLSKISSIACDICKDLYEGEERTKNATMRCLECKDNFCHICAKAHVLHKASISHHIIKLGTETEEDMRRISPIRNCGDHNQKPLDYYCPQCKKIVCVSCVLETHVSHGCRDVSTVEDEFRQLIEGNALKISTYGDEMLFKAKCVEERKGNIQLKIAEIESKIQQRNLKLKETIERSTKSLLEQLSQIKQKEIKNCENEKEEIDRNHTILRSFETYCMELRSKGSPNEICSCVDKLSERADELEKDHEAFISRPCRLNEVSFNATDLGVNTWSRNIVGRIDEIVSQIEKCVVIVGLHDGQNLSRDVFKISLHRPQEISTEQPIPTKVQYGSAAAVYCNTLYVTGIGDKYNEIWKYKLASSWMKCGYLVQGRIGHCAEFIDEILYICGGHVSSDGRILDSVESYNAVINKCKTVGKLVHCVKNSANCVPFRSSLYIFGGRDKDNKLSNHVQVYNTKLNTSTLLSKPIPHSFDLMRTVLWETSVIFLGWNTCFMFNFETQTWQERKQFKTDAVHFGLALENGRIFVIGGGMSAADESGVTKWTCRDDVRYVSLQSFINDKPFEWKPFAKLPRPSLLLTYGKLT